MKRSQCFFYTLAMAMLFFTSMAFAAAPVVSVSIKPIHSLTAAVMKGVAKPFLLVRGSASPHDYALKPSDAKKLSHSQLIFWMGPTIDGFLQKPLATLAANARVVEFGTQTILQTPTNGRQKTDLHLWLDPRKARSMVAIIVAELSALDPANIFRYRANASALSKRLDNLDMQITAKLSGLSKKPFLVLHDAFRHLQKAYGLNIAGAVSINGEIPPSPRLISRLRDKIRRLDIHCLFSEPQFDPAIIRPLTSGFQVKIGILDPIGSELDPGTELYFQMMQANADSLYKCLGGLIKSKNKASGDNNGKYNN